MPPAVGRFSVNLVWYNILKMPPADFCSFEDFEGSSSESSLCRFCD